MSLRPARPTFINVRLGSSRPADLAVHECLLLREQPSSFALRHSDHAQEVEVAIRGRFRINSVGMIRRMATLDMGIAMLAEKIVEDELAEGRLLRVLPEWQGSPISVYAVTETRLLPAKTQRFIEFLRDHLAQT